MVDSASRCPVHFTPGFISAGHDCARCPGRPDEVFHSGGPASLIASLSFGCLGVCGCRCCRPRQLHRARRRPAGSGSVKQPATARPTRAGPVPHRRRARPRAHPRNGDRRLVGHPPRRPRPRTHSPTVPTPVRTGPGTHERQHHRRRAHGDCQRRARRRRRAGRRVVRAWCGCPGSRSPWAPRSPPRTVSTRSRWPPGVPAGIAWLYPLITDGLALVAYAATARLRGPAARYAWSVVVLAAGLSGLAQAALLGSETTMDAPTVLRYGVGAWPAVAAAIVAHLLYLLATHTADAPTSTAGVQPAPFRSAGVQPAATTVQPAPVQPAAGRARSTGRPDRCPASPPASSARRQRQTIERSDGRGRPRRGTGHRQPLRGTPTATAACPPSPNWRQPPRSPAAPPRPHSSPARATGPPAPDHRHAGVRLCEPEGR